MQATLKNSDSTKIERAITRSLKAEVRGSVESLEQPLFAINWFDTRVALVYHFYNLLAARRVFRVGARVLFKGKRIEMISGDEDLSRKFLLVVNYPSADRFLDLLSDRIFQLVSVFRAVAVKQFSFVLHHRFGEPQLLPEQKTSFESNTCYAVFHFSTTNQPTLDFEDLCRIAGDYSVEVFFASHAVGRVAIVKRDGAQNEMPFVTDRTVLFSSTSRSSLDTFFDSPKFAEFTSRTTGFYVAHFQRTM